MAANAEFQDLAASLVWQVLRENNIVLAKDTLFFYMKMLLRLVV